MALSGDETLKGPPYVVDADGRLQVEGAFTADPFGATADAAVTAGATGSISAKLRSISRDLIANIVLAAGSNIIGRVGHDSTGLGDGNQEVAAAGTAEALVGSSTPAKWIVVSAQPANTNEVAVGSATVDATAGAEQGAILAAGDSVTLLIDNVQDVFVDAVTTGEGVSFVYGT